MNAYFYNFNAKKSAHYDIKRVDELPEAEPRPSAEDIESAVNHFGFCDYAASVTEIRADDLPSVDEGYYGVFEIETHEFYPGDGDTIKEDIEYKYVVAFQPDACDDGAAD